MKQSSSAKVSFLTKFMYAVGDAPFSFSVTLIGFFLMIYLTNTIGISAFWAGAIIFLGIVWDAITDPVVGYLNDNTRSKLGRRRKYMFLFLLPMAITFLMLFSVPSMLRSGSELEKVLVTMALYLLFTTFMTLVATPFGAIINEITDDYDERTKMTTFRMASSVIGTLLSIIIPEFLGLANASQSNASSYVWMGLIFAVLMLIFGYSSTLALYERKRDLNPTKHAFDFKKYFIHSWKSAPFRQVTIMYMFSVALMNFIQGNLVYFINYKMLLPGIFLPIAGGVMVLAILFMPIWMILASKKSKKTAYMVAVTLIAVALLSLYFVPAYDYAGYGIQTVQATPEMLLPQYQHLEVFYIPDMNTDMGVVIKVLWEESPWVYFSILLLAFGFSGIQMLPFTMVPDAVNFSANAKEKKEGAYFGIVTFVQKMGWGLGMLMTGIVLHASGYLEPAKVFTFDAQNNDLVGMIVLQSDSSVVAITILFTLIPALFGVFGMLSLKNYQVDREALAKQIETINA
ncbi:MAG: MFS transporter, partial [Candidatus Izemoplasmatales bacterium]|nr:MFS transporter [Candidatus Izemoplasmatales bacterium]